MKKRMKKEIKALWVEALRSGLYRQGKAALRPTDTGKVGPDGKWGSFCCLGVLCDLMPKMEWVDCADEVEGFPRADYKDKDEVQIERTWAGIPESVQRWAGLDTDSPGYVEEGGIDRSLVWLNDDQGASFDVIADVIEDEF